MRQLALVVGDEISRREKPGVEKQDQGNHHRAGQRPEGSTRQRVVRDPAMPASTPSFCKAGVVIFRTQASSRIRYMKM